jgi:hypothetical protein
MSCHDNDKPKKVDPNQATSLLKDTYEKLKNLQPTDIEGVTVPVKRAFPRIKQKLSKK